MLVQLAFRNIWRNRRRTLLTLSALVISSSLLILSLGIFSGMMEDMLISATEQYYGHILLSSPGYQDDRDIYLNLPEDPALLKRLATQPHVQGISARLRSFGLLATGVKSYPVEMLGVEPTAESSVTHFSEKLVAGRFLHNDSAREVVIGSGLAAKLNVQPGEELVFVGQAADGSIANDLLQVAGVFNTGDSSHDNGLVITGLKWLQDILVLPGRIHEISLRIDQALLAPTIASTLPHMTSDGDPLEIFDWGKLLPEMQEAIASYDVSRVILACILYAAAGLGVLNTFFMSVLERTHEFGVLRAIGLRKRQLWQLLLLETLLLGLTALALGLLLGLFMTYLMCRFGWDLSSHMTAITYAGGTILPRLRAVFDLANFTVPAFFLLIICLAAGLLPARRASRLSPMDAIRNE